MRSQHEGPKPYGRDLGICEPHPPKRTYCRHHMEAPLTPEQQPRVQAFDPLVLDRTVIAVPLLAKMKEDLELIEKVRADHPEELKKFNSAIRLNEKYPGGAEGALKKVLEMAEDAGTKALETAAKRLAHAGEAVDETDGVGHDADGVAQRGAWWAQDREADQ